MTNFNIVTEFLCLVVCLWYYRWLRNSFWWIFLPFLVTTLFIEVLATYIWSTDNGWLYNTYVQVQFIFFGYFYYSVIEAKRLRRVILCSGAIFFLASLYEFSFRTSFHTFSLLLFTVDSFLTVAFAQYYHEFPG